jgi:hypothetical protein
MSLERQRSRGRWLREQDDLHLKFYPWLTQIIIAIGAMQQSYLGNTMALLQSSDVK